MADYAQINNNHSTATANYTTKQHSDGTGGDFGDVLKAKEEMLDKIKHGTIQPKIQIGAQEYTQEEWKKLLEKFDEAEEDLIEQVEEEIEARIEQIEDEKAMLEAIAEAEMRSSYSDKGEQ